MPAAACSSRAATLTASPSARRWSAAGVGRRDDLAGVDAGPVRQRDPVAGARAPRSGGTAPAASRARRARRASASSSRTLGRPNTAMIASPMYFSILPPWRSMTSAIAVEVAVLDLVHRLGVDRLAERRRALEVGEDDRDGLAQLLGGRACTRTVPQKPHSRNFAGFSSPQLGQVTTSMAPSLATGAVSASRGDADRRGR